MKLKLKIKGKEYVVEIKETEKGELKIKVGDKEFIFQKKEKDSIAQTSLPKRDFSEKEIVAPIAGLISDIFVKEGGFVEKGGRVVLLSAMKMENEIISESGGKIKKILIKKNQQVKEKDILVILE